MANLVLGLNEKKWASWENETHDKLAVLDRLSKHSSLDKIRWEKYLEFWSRKLAMVCAYNLKLETNNDQKSLVLPVSWQQKHLSRYSLMIYNRR